MRKVIIEIECENDAFVPHPEVELAEILRRLSQRMYDAGIVEGWKAVGAGRSTDDKAALS
jgi:hypothetical protein